MKPIFNDIYIHILEKFQNQLVYELFNGHKKS